MGIVALGMTFVIITGGIDLAVGSMLVATGAVIMTLIDTGASGILGVLGITGVWAYVIAIIVALIMGYILGTGSGLLITRAHCSFIAMSYHEDPGSVTQHFM